MSARFVAGKTASEPRAFDHVVRIVRDDGKPDSTVIAKTVDAQWAEHIAAVLNEGRDTIR